MTTTKIKPLTKKQIAENEKQEAIANLRRVAPPGSTIFGIVRSVARSGMSRTVDFYVKSADPAYRDDAGLRYLSGWFATAGGYSRDKSGALKIGGCGMDMVFGTVYNVASATWRGTKVPEAGKRNGRRLRADSQNDSPGYVWKSRAL